MIILKKYIYQLLLLWNELNNFLFREGKSVLKE